MTTPVSSGTYTSRTGSLMDDVTWPYVVLALGNAVLNLFTLMLVDRIRSVQKNGRD